MESEHKIRLRTETHVRFWHDDEMVSTERSSGDLKNLVIPDDVFAIQFFDIGSCTVSLCGQFMRLTSEEFDVSPRLYVNGRILTLEEFKTQLPDEYDEFLRKAYPGNYYRVVLCSSGQWLPFCEDDRICSVDSRLAKTD